MSMNRIANQALDLMQGMVSLPFQAMENVWTDQNSTLSRFMQQSIQLAEGMAAVPFNVARDFLQPDSVNSTSETDSNQ